MSKSAFSPQQLEERAHWLPPEDLIAHLELKPGMNVAEISSGSGRYSSAIARQLGNASKVFAVEALASTTAEHPPSNLEDVAGTPWRSHLPDASCDVVLMADLLDELTDRQGALDEARRILKPGGKLVILEWRRDAHAPPGPPLERRVSLEEMVRLLEMNAWSLVRRSEEWADGYLLVFEPTDESVQS